MGLAASKLLSACQMESSMQALQEITITECQTLFATGKLSSQELVQYYLERIEAIDRAGPTLKAIIELNPGVLITAASLDEERATSGPRGPLHGIPILLKDNIDTDDAMQTTAGSLALLGSRPTQDATVVDKLRQAGVVILGKTNLSEWANFRSTVSVSGWSGRGGQTHNPYVLTHNPCGSSSGSGTAVSANLAMVALGTETDGSIVCPAHVNGIVGIKPTVGLTSRAGVIPIAHSQDTVGPMARTVADAALLLGALTGVDERDGATAASAGRFYDNYAQFLDADGLHGARMGVIREVYAGYDTAVDSLMDGAIAAMRQAGAIIIDPANIPSATQMKEGNSEFEVLLYEFKADIAAYLATRVGAEVPRTLADLIAFNLAHAEAEMPHFAQEIFDLAEAKGPLTDEEYLTALATSQRLSRQEGIDAVMDEHQLDVLIAPTGGPAWLTSYEKSDKFSGSSSSPAAQAGYPLITVPMGFVGELPVGLTFMGRAFSEPTLIKVAYAFEQATQARRVPQFLPE
jgi:amidase